MRPSTVELYPCFIERVFILLAIKPPADSLVPSFPISCALCWLLHLPSDGKRWITLGGPSFHFHYFDSFANLFSNRLRTVCQRVPTNRRQQIARRSKAEADVLRESRISKKGIRCCSWWRRKFPKTTLMSLISLILKRVLYHLSIMALIRRSLDLFLPDVGWRSLSFLVALQGFSHKIWRDLL